VGATRLGPWLAAAPVLAAVVVLGAPAAPPSQAPASAPLAAHSADGRWTLRADAEARALQVIDVRSGAVARSIDVMDRQRRPSRIARILDAPPRRSFIVLLADVPEAWELSYDPGAAPVYSGLVHDFRLGEGLPESGPLPVQRLHLDVPLTTALFAPSHDVFIAQAANGRLHVVSLHVRRPIERLPLPAGAVVEHGVAWQRGAVPLFILPDRAAPLLHVLDGRDWRWRSPLTLPARAIGLRIEGNARLAVDLAGAGRVTLELDPLVSPAGG
jgi:hypothetical protein